MSAAIIFLAMGVYGGVHSLLATGWAKSLARRHFGVAAERGYRLAYNLFAVLSFLPVVYLVAALPDRVLYTISWPWVLLSGAGQLLGATIVLLGVRQTDPWHFLGLRQLGQGEQNASPTLTVSGLYRYVRHPLYSGGLLFIWLTPRLSVNLLALNLGLTLYILIGARLEERRLLAEFGEAYAQYRRRVPMLIPNPLALLRQHPRQ